MTTEPGMGFTPSASSSKKREVIPTPNPPETKIVNNFVSIRVGIDPEFLVVVLVALVLIVASQFAPAMRA
jgi:hypothetical protein